MHQLRVNYQAYIWRQSHICDPKIPSPVGLGWKMDDANSIQVDWLQGNMMPIELSDILEDRKSSDNEPQSSAMNTNIKEVDEDVEEDYEVENILDIIFEDDEDD